MGTQIKGRRLLYFDNVESIEKLTRKISVSSPDDISLLLGEYGIYSPLAVMHGLKDLWKGTAFMELVAANKNRDLIRSYILSAAHCGFNGVVMASGNFNKTPGMAQPVYDLDPAQMLTMAVTLRKEGAIPGDFLLIVRVPEGSEAARTRARWFIENGADFIAVKEEAADELKEKSLIIIES